MFFTKKVNELRNINRALTETLRKRSERIEELERRVANLQALLEKSERAPGEVERANKALRDALQDAKRFEAAATERAHAVNQMNLELTAVREATANYSSWGHALEDRLIEIGTKETERREAWRKHVAHLGVPFRES